MKAVSTIAVEERQTQSLNINDCSDGSKGYGPCGNKYEGCDMDGKTC